MGAGRLTGETDHDTLRAIAVTESVSIRRNASACGAEPFSPCSCATTVEGRLPVGGIIPARAASKRGWRADARAGNRPDRRLARNPATRDQRIAVSLARSRRPFFGSWALTCVALPTPKTLDPRRLCE